MNDAAAVANAQSWLGWMLYVRIASLVLLASGAALALAEGWLSSNWQHTVDQARDRDVEVARKEAAQARLELAKYREPRVLTVEQQNRIISKMRDFAQTSFDGAYGPAGDLEPLQLFDQIHDMLRAAGWTPKHWPGDDIWQSAGRADAGVTSVWNVLIDVNPTHWAKLGPAAKALAAALKDEGIEADVATFSTMTDERISVRIGRRR